jgi:hypothetical protein
VAVLHGWLSFIRIKVDRWNCVIGKAVSHTL